MACDSQGLMRGRGLFRSNRRDTLIGSALKHAQTSVSGDLKHARTIGTITGVPDYT
jgi:hypothetical protein